MTTTKKAFFKGNKEKIYDVIQLNEGKSFYERLVDLDIITIKNDSMMILLDKSSISIKLRIELILEILYDVKEHHDQGIIHGDISAENIKEHQSKLQLIDYGVSKLLSGKDHVQTSSIFYKKNYGAPEVINNGMYSLASDIYALGYLIRHYFFSEDELNQPNLKPLKDILDRMQDKQHTLNSLISIPVPKERPGILEVITVFKAFLCPRPAVLVHQPGSTRIGGGRSALPSSFNHLLPDSMRPR